MKKRILAVVVVVIIIIILTVSLLASSMKSIQSHEIGLKYNNIYKTLNQEIYYEGLHVGQPGLEIIKFSAVFRSMQLNSFVCLNKDEVEIELMLSFEYRIRASSLFKVIKLFKDEEGHDEILIPVAHSAIHEACSKFNTSQFQTDRGSFQLAVKDILTSKFDKVHTDLNDLQMQDIKRPSAYEEAIQDKETAREDIDVARQEEPKKITIAKNNLEEVKNEAEINVQKAESSAKVILTKAKSRAETIKDQYRAEAKVYKELRTSLGFSELDFIKYMASRAIFSDNKSKIDLAIAQPAQLDSDN